MPLKRPDDRATLREHFAWIYGTLSMYNAAVRDGITNLKKHRGYYAIRSQFWKKYQTGDMKMRPLFDDQKTKISFPNTCCYCGCKTKPSLDHVIPKLKGGPDAADNITYACKSCNSSKGPKDMVQWLLLKNRFPSILVFQQYLKLAARYCEDVNLMDTPWEDVSNTSLPFDKRSLRVKWPNLSELRLWPDPPNPG